MTLRWGIPVAYWRFFYHIVWATKERQPLIQSDFAPALHGRIANKARQLGAIVHAVGGTEDHVHVAVSILPGIALSEFIGQLKGSSSHFASHELGASASFAWQTDYGVISVSSRQVRSVVQYIKDQTRHHDQNTAIPQMERFVSEDS